MHPQSLNSVSIQTLHQLKHTRIFVAGDIILDSYTEGRVSRISPEAPVPVLLETGKKHVPGGAGNVAANIASMGAFVQICARVGYDTEASILKEHLEAFGINIQALIAEENIPTTTKTRIVSNHEFTSNSHQLVRMDREVTSGLQPASVEKCIEKYREFISQGEHCALVLSDYGKGFLTLELIKNLIEISVAHNIPVITDPKSLDVSRYQNSTIIKPNLSEGRHLFRATQTTSPSFFSFDEEVSCIAKHYLSLSGCRNIVMSLSQRGILAMGKDIHHSNPESVDTQDHILHLPTQALQVSDVSGAGDTVIAFLAMGLAAKLTLAAATELGNLAAGIVCRKQGTAVVYEHELFNALRAQSHTFSSEKVSSLENLISITKTLQNKNKKIVFTNGCFDILHAGHVTYLQKAKSLGDFLIIGLNSDESVKRLKGPTRPVQTASDRAQILSALSCVDFVVEFNDDTPLALIRALKPDLLVKGADYNLSNTVGAEDVLSWGGRVEHLALLEGRSTTNILSQL